jgi:hypothetical protein
MDVAADTSPPDVGPEDTSGPDTSPDTGTDPVPSDCDGPLASTIFCDGFEDGLTAWGVGTGGDGRVAHDTRAYRGAGSLRADIESSSDRAGVYYSGLGPVDAGTLYFRGWYYLPRKGLENVSFVILQEEARPWDHVSFSTEGDGALHMWIKGPNVGVTGGTVAVPRDRWFCFQATIDVRDAGGTVTAYIDEVEAASTSGLDSRPGAGYASVFTGLPFNGAGQGPYTLYVDEVAIDDAPIPCSP